MHFLKLQTIPLVLLLGACGGGGDDSPPPPVASTATFPVRAAFDGIATTGVNVNLIGKDTATRTVNRDDFNDWSGSYSMSKRAATTTFISTTPSCAAATTMVDMSVSLTRKLDGLRMQEAVTFGYDSTYKPVCALLLDGHYWTWNLSESLPVTSGISGNLTGVQFTGTASRTIDPLDIDSELTGVVGLDADTTSSAYLSFTYHVNSIDAATALPFRMLGEDTTFRFRIDSSGKFIGFQYVRTGVVSDGSGPFTITMNAQ